MFVQWQVLVPFTVLLAVSSISSEWLSNDAEECIGVPPGETPEYVGDASVIIDEVLQAVSVFLKERNHTQIDVPDQESDFEFFLLKGHLSLSEGKVSGYDRMKRIGNAEIKYLEKSTSSSVAVKFEDPSIFFKNTTVTISSNTFNGTLNTSFEHLTMRINMSVNLTSLCKKIDSVKVENLGSINVKFDIKSWIPNALSKILVNTVTWIYKNRLAPAIEERTAKAIQAFLNEIDLNDVLKPHPLEYIFKRPDEEVH